MITYLSSLVSPHSSALPACFLSLTNVLFHQLVLTTAIFMSMSLPFCLCKFLYLECSPHPTTFFKDQPRQHPFYESFSDVSLPPFFWAKANMLSSGVTQHFGHISIVSFTRFCYVYTISCLHSFVYSLGIISLRVSTLIFPDLCPQSIYSVWQLAWIQ